MKMYRFFAVLFCFFYAGSNGFASDEVEELQRALQERGFYHDEIDGVYDEETAAAVTRFQIRNGLAITGDLDSETRERLGLGPAGEGQTPVVTQPENTWRELRKPPPQPEPAKETKAEPQEIPPSDAPSAEETPDLPPEPEPEPEAVSTEPPPPAPVEKIKPKPQEPETEPLDVPPARQTTAPPPPPPEAPEVEKTPRVERATRVETPAPRHDLRERLRDYVGAFILAGLNPDIDAELQFFADEVRYFDDGMKDKSSIRKDLRRYVRKWPDRRFWLAGDMEIERQRQDRIEVTYPLRYELRSPDNSASGKVLKTIVVEPMGDDFEIVAVNERKM